MRLLITGSNGFVGQNWITYSKSIVPTWQNFFLNRNYINRNNIEGLFVNIDVVLHLAGKAHDKKNSSHNDEYYQINTVLTKKIFDQFLKSDAKVFITLSSVKAAADTTNVQLTEECIPNPITHYGKSKLLAEEYIVSMQIPEWKRVFILRPCMIHGPGNKGNLNLLFKVVKKRIPWPLGAFENKRSFCSIDNLCFVIQQLIENENIPSGVYNIADDEPLSTNDVIKLIANSQGKKSNIWYFPKTIITIIAKLGDLIKLPLNTERLKKLTESYVVRNSKIKQAINKSLPVSSRDGLFNTFKSFNSNTR